MSLKFLLPLCEMDSCPNRHRFRPAFLVSSSRLVFNGRRHCGPECFERAVEEAARHLLVPRTPPIARNHRVPLGLVLLQRGQISEEKLKQALHAQREARHGRVGEWLRRIGGVSEEQLTQALGIQWACPVFPLQRSHHYLDAATLVPLPIQDSLRMMPVHYLGAGRQLYVAFPDMVDHRALNALERMLECRTHPCLAEESAFEQAMHMLRNRPRLNEAYFECLRDPAEMARAARRHAIEVSAQEVRMVGCGDFVWMRLNCLAKEWHLAFKTTTEGSQQRGSSSAVPLALSAT